MAEPSWREGRQKAEPIRMLQPCLARMVRRLGEKSESQSVRLSGTSGLEL